MGKKKKAFSPGAIISVGHHVLLCELDELYAILEHLTGEAPYTHQLLRFMRECDGYLKKTFPEIMAAYTVHGKDEALSFIKELDGKFGSQVLVDGTPDGIEHVSIDHVSEAESMIKRRELCSRITTLD